MRGEITGALAFRGWTLSVDGRAIASLAESSGSPWGSSAETLGHDRLEPVERVLEAVVDDDVGELGLGVQLVLGDEQPPLDLLVAVRAASDQALAQRLQG